MSATVYEQDFDVWALHNAELLRQGRLTEIDAEHIADELESMGKRDRRELLSRLKILIGHMLKWRFQPTQRCSSWRGSIIEQRLQVHDLLDDNPNLRQPLPQLPGVAYPDAVKLASKETGLPPSVFPVDCPYTVEQLLNDDFFSET